MTDDCIQAEAELLWQYCLVQTRYWVEQMARALDIFLCGKVSEQTLRSVRQERNLAYTDLERYAHRWVMASAAAPEIKAAMAHRVGTQYTLVRCEMPDLWRVLELDSQAVAMAYQQLYQQPLTGLFSTTHLSEPPSPTHLVEDVSPDDLQALANALERVRLSSGDVVCCEGERGDSMYVISSGLVQVVRGEGEKRQVIAECGRDETIGEIALLTGEPRSATLIAVRDTELFRISKETFDRLVERRPHLMLAFTRTIAQRLSASERGERRLDVAVTIAILPAGQNAHIAAFTAGLQRALSKRGAVLHLNSERLNQALFKDAAQTCSESALEGYLMGWLCEGEYRHDFVLYEADAEMNEWTRRCIRQADRIVLVGMGEETPGLNAVEEAIFNSGEFNPNLRKELVLLHPHDNLLPRGTAAWLRERPVERCYHVALDNPTHQQRLVRYLTRQPVAIVLSGGGMRGLAHVGVLKALREAGIPVDAICAASAGSIVGSLYSMGKDDRALENLAQQLLCDAKLLADYTLPLASLVAGERLNRLLERLYGETCIEDLWLQFMCTSVDLTNATLLTHRRGLLRRYIRASSSMPVVLPPVLEGQHLLVDGGLMNNLPVNQLMEAIPNCALILVNVTKAFYNANANYNYGESLPFWKVVNGHFNPLAEKLVLPGITQVLMRCLEIGSKSSEAAQIAKVDLYIRPQVEDVPTDKTDNIQHVIQAGYVAAQKALENSSQGHKLIFKETL
jgi:predicted acylesterase/phospholipase RssA/CRP-like cAMP-binding protein